METATKATEQFLRDFLLVSENDAEIYFEYRNLVKRVGTWEAGVKIREQFEAWIINLAYQEEERGNEYGALLLKQLLIGWGSDVFYEVAKRFQEEN
jgi:hypothetical protein